MLFSIFSIIVSNMLFATALALIAVVVTRFWRNPSLSHVLWGLVLIKLITPPLAVFSIPEDSLDGFVRPPATVAEFSAKQTEYVPFTEAYPSTIVDGPLNSQPDREESVQSRSHQTSDFEEPVPPRVVVAVQSTESVEPRIEDGFIFLLRANWQLVVVAIWGCGTLVYGLALLCRLSQFRRVLAAAWEAPSEISSAATELASRMGLRRCPPIRVVDAPIPPLVWSIGIRPIVLLPGDLLSGMRKAQRDAVIAHELAHVRRRDDLARWLEVVVLMLFWWNPIAWLARNRLRAAEEECCDAWVVWILPKERRSYGEALLKTIEFLSNRRHVLPVHAGSTFGSSYYKQRFETIIKGNVSREMSRSGLALVLVVSLVILPAAAQTRSIATQQKTETVDRLSDTADGSEQGPLDVQKTGLRSDSIQRPLSGEIHALPVALRGPMQRGEGTNREMLLRGRVLGADGNPARDLQLTAKLGRSRGAGGLLPTILDGNQFEIWVPVGGSHFLYLELAAESADGTSRVFDVIWNRNLREVAIKGVDLQLAPTNRFVDIFVNYNGRAVANAHVNAELGGNGLLSGDTDSNGKATFRLCKGEAIGQLTAWTDDFRMGGYSFSRKPYRDPSGTQFTIDLDDCRDQTIRLFDMHDHSPVANVSFELFIGTGPPNYNFAAIPATLPYCRMTTDANGQAKLGWFPDRNTLNDYVEIVDTRWAAAVSNRHFMVGDDGALVLPLQRCMPRKLIKGRVTSVHHDVGGLLVEIKSFQGDQEWQPDCVYAFTNADGSFTAECIPDATYTMCVNDARLASNIIDLIPYETDTGRSSLPVLEVHEGRPVEIRVTTGPRREPMENQVVHVGQRHRYTWLENGERRVGVRTRSFPVCTDTDGVAHVRAMSGSELRITVNAGEWRSPAQDVIVGEDGAGPVRIHREIDDEREVTGRLVAPPGVDVELVGAQIVYGSIDGETDERETITTDAEGRFAFNSKAIRLGVFAYTADGNAAGIATPASVERPIVLQLRPTMDLHGQLLGTGDVPIAHHAVRVSPRVGGKRVPNKSFAMSFEAKTFEATTDADGNYTLKNLPTEFAMRLRADSMDSSTYDARLDDFRLAVGVENPKLVSRIDHARESEDPTLAN